MKNTEKEKKILFDNVKTLLEERTDNGEKMFYELSELSYIFARHLSEEHSGLSEQELIEEELRQILNEEKLPVRSSLPEYAKLLEEEQARTLLMQKAAFSLFLAQRIGKKRDTAARSDRFCIACVQSPLAADAYEKIAQIKENATVLYVESSEEALIAITAGDADCALLPLSYRGGERIASIERLSERYGVYLNASVSVETDGEATALGVFSLQNLPLAEGEDENLEFRFTTWSYDAAARIVSFLPTFGFETVRFSCISADDGRIGARVVLRGAGEETALWFFLSLTANGFTALGRYPLL